MGFGSRAVQHCPYPDPEDIRHLYTLHRLLFYIQPERKLNSLSGPLMDVIEAGTGVVFVHHVPKKLLVLFLGRKVVNKFIKTVERENMADWKGKPVKQVLLIPQGVASQAAFRVLVAWMLRACQYKTMGQMRNFRVPQNTLVACTLAQILALLGLHKDALRVDSVISKEHFSRPIFPVELETLWNCLGEGNRYVYATIKTVGERLTIYEIGSSKKHPMWEEMLQLLEEYPPLKERVRDLELNEQYRQIFSREWMANLTTNTGSEPHPPGSEFNTEISRNPSRELDLGSSEESEHETSSAQVEVPEKAKRHTSVLRIML